jgi:ketosteroid isomerase-like protein
MGASHLPEDFDQIAIAVDWLDACRRRDLEALLDLYAQDARIECRCGSVELHQGRLELEAYWRPQLERFATTAFGLEDISPTADGVELDYLNSDGTPVRAVFSFDPQGKISRMRCLRIP